MATYTTEAAVNKIIEYDTTLIPDITDFIAGAENIVAEVIDIDTLPTPASLELVSRYLAGHLIAITDQQVASEQVKSLQTSYQYRLSDGLGITRYGIMAMAFDTTGRLAAYNQRIISGGGRLQFFWAGEEVTTEEEA